jgi:hypothetical protein
MKDDFRMQTGELPKYFLGETEEKAANVNEDSRPSAEKQTLGLLGKSTNQ